MNETSLHENDLHDIEAAATASWPALEEERRRGWILRFSRGYTGRANSVNATPGSEPLRDGDLTAIEARYRDRGLPPLFRLAEFSAPPGLDAALEARGYRPRDRSLVMTLPAGAFPAVEESSRAFDDVAAWLELFQSVSGKRSTDQATHLELVRRIAPPRMLLVRESVGQPVACGLGVLANGWLGLFDIATAADQRRRGHGRALCRELLSRGRALRARGAYLQVLASNAPAIALYEAMGFRTAYAYGYRQAEV